MVVRALNINEMKSSRGKWRKSHLMRESILINMENKIKWNQKENQPKIESNFELGFK